MAELGPAAETIIVPGFDADVDARESQVCELCTELLDEWNEPETEDDEERCEYVDQGQWGRESGEGRPGEFEREMGRGEDMERAGGGYTLR